MTLVPWFVAVGAILIAIALTSSFLRRMPLSTAIICLGFGVVFGPAGAGLIHLDFMTDANILESLTEVAVIISLFTAGLQLRLPLHRKEWRVSVRLATVGMMLIVAALAFLGVQTRGCRSVQQSFLAPCWRLPTQCWLRMFKCGTRPTPIGCGLC